MHVRCIVKWRGQLPAAVSYWLSRLMLYAEKMSPTIIVHQLEFYLCRLINCWCGRGLVVYTNVVSLRQARLVLGWATVFSERYQVDLLSFRPLDSVLSQTNTLLLSSPTNSRGNSLKNIYIYTNFVFLRSLSHETVGDTQADRQTDKQAEGKTHKAAAYEGRMINSWLVNCNRGVPGGC